MKEKRKLKDKIIKFIQNSPDEVNSQLAVFIAGMQAQKSLTDCKKKSDRSLTKGETAFLAAKTGPPLK
ncbi:MAG: hypothetical protein LBI14_08630 [Treponema sp.]|jgi:hypothetical protein|nr:hypothetical protein [Treponema sp.]